MEKVIIKRIDKALALPKYETNGAIAFDLITRLDTVVEAGKIALIPSNVIVKVPQGYMLVLASRSSSPIKKGLSTPHGIGIIDNDYHGPEDELKVQVYNFTDKDITVVRGDRVAQGVFIRVDKVEFEEVDEIQAPSRGGFGSTN